MISLSAVDLDKMAPWLAEMKAAGLSIAASTDHYAIYRHSKLVGFTGLMWIGSTARFKTSYVFPQYRRQGIYAESQKLLIDIAKARNATMLEATATKMSIKWFLDNGFEAVEKFKDMTKVKKPA